MPVWEKYETEDGTPYYFNTETEETTWDLPADYDGDEAVQNAEATDDVDYAGTEAGAQADPDTGAETYEGVVYVVTYKVYFYCCVASNSDSV